MPDRFKWNVDFGEHLRKQRERRGYNLVTMSNRALLSRHVLHGLEQGLRHRVYLIQVVEICRALDMRVEDMIALHGRPRAFEPLQFDELDSRIRNNVRKLRTAAGTTARALGESVGKDQSHITRLEGGDYKAGRLDVAELRRIAACLRVKVKALFAGKAAVKMWPETTGATSA